MSTQVSTQVMRGPYFTGQLVRYQTERMHDPSSGRIVAVSDLTVTVHNVYGEAVVLPRTADILIVNPRTPTVHDHSHGHHASTGDEWAGPRKSDQTREEPSAMSPVTAKQLQIVCRKCGKTATVLYRTGHKPELCAACRREYVWAHGKSPSPLSAQQTAGPTAASAPAKHALAPRECIDCHTEYQPASPPQKRCPECREKHDREVQLRCKREYAARQRAARTGRVAPPTPPPAPAPASAPASPSVSSSVPVRVPAVAAAPLVPGPVVAGTLPAAPVSGQVLAAALDLDVTTLFDFGESLLPALRKIRTLRRVAQVIRADAQEG